MVPHLRDVLGSVRSVPQEPWTLIYLVKFRPPLPFFSPVHFPVLPVFQYFCRSLFMFCSPSRPHCVQKLWWELCCLPTSCFQWVLDLGMTLVRVSHCSWVFLTQRLVAGRHTELDHFFLFRWNKWFFQLRLCVLWESSCLGLCLGSLFVPGREGEGVKFDISALGEHHCNYFIVERT